MKLSNALLWNPFLRFLIEGYIEFCIVGFLNMLSVNINY